MRSRLPLLLPLLLLVTASCGDDAPALTLDAASPGLDAALLPDGGAADALVPETIPTGDEWKDHLTDELLPYYTIPAALGQPVGNFPTFRCDDGTVYHAVDNACSELATTDSWITSELGRDYTRMKSRQTFLYGVAYHMTGDEELFEYHLAGVRWLREHCLDPDGGAYTYFENGVPGPASALRTSQDQSYAVLGLAMNYYLTRDPEVLDDIVTLKRYIFATYWDEAMGMLRWTPSDQQRELVAQLDQVNAYLLLTLPLLPAELRTEWEADLRRLVGVMLEHFYSPQHQLFWGAVTTPQQMTVGSFHTDFGHTIKAYWMIFMIGRLLDEPSWTSLARDGAEHTFELAYIRAETPFGDPGPSFAFEKVPYLGAWAEKLTGADVAAGDPVQVWPGTEWWSYCELDQMAATLALEDHSFLAYLATTYPRYFERLVDPQFGGVFHKRTNSDRIEYAKAHLWKNGYHEAEHALVGYLTSQALRGGAAELFFAFHEQAVNQLVRPYLYEGDDGGQQAMPFASHPEFERVRVTFTAIH